MHNRYLINTEVQITNIHKLIVYMLCTSSILIGNIVITCNEKDFVSLFDFFVVCYFQFIQVSYLPLLLLSSHLQKVLIYKIDILVRVTPVCKPMVFSTKSFSFS